MLTLLVFFGLIFLEAFYETNYDSGKKTLSGLVEFILRALTTIALFAWMVGKDFSTLWTVDVALWRLVVGYLLIRYSLFSIIYNLFRSDLKLDIFYVGQVKLYDKLLRGFLQKTGFPPSVFLGVTKLMTFILGAHIIELKYISITVTLSVIVIGFLLPIISLIIKLIKKK